MKEWTGKDILKLRSELGMKRPQFAQLLHVSVSILEKWESHENQNRPLKAKYLETLKNIASGKISQRGALAAASLVAAPTIVAPAALLGLIASKTGIFEKLSDKNLDKGIEFLNELKKLSPDEREKFLKLLSKLEN